MTYKQYFFSWLKRNGYFKVILELCKRHKISNNSIDSYFDNSIPQSFITNFIITNNGFSINTNNYENLLLNKLKEINAYWLIELYNINNDYFYDYVKDLDNYDYYQIRNQSCRLKAFNIIHFISVKKRMPTEEEMINL